jgi:hypothetical protein
MELLEINDTEITKEGLRFLAEAKSLKTVVVSGETSIFVNEVRRVNPRVNVLMLATAPPNPSRPAIAGCRSRNRDWVACTELALKTTSNSPHQGEGRNNLLQTSSGESSVASARRSRRTARSTMA